MIELPSASTSYESDALFLERLDIFCGQTLLEAVRSFAEREQRSLEQVQRSVAVWHSKQLFDSSMSTANSTARLTLGSISDQLDNLRSVASVESFVLAVDPHQLAEDTTSGFLGGTVAGRQFWREFRHGGEGGAKAFRQFCSRTAANAPATTSASSSQMVLPSSTSSRPTAQNIKTELYDAMRRSLRFVSGVRNAEMKWTNLERLHAFGVRLVGWPEDVPLQNPSILKTSQNTALLAALRTGSMRFERLDALPGAAAQLTTGNDEQDISWAYSEPGECFEDSSSRNAEDSQRAQKRLRSGST